MLQCSFSFAAAQLLQKSRCCSAVSAAQHSENCSATSIFACGMLQGWGLEGCGLGLAERLLATLRPLKNISPAFSYKLFTAKNLRNKKGAEIWEGGGNPNLFKLRSLDSSCRFSLSDSSIELNCSKCFDCKAIIAVRTSKCYNR